MQGLPEDKDFVFELLRKWSIVEIKVKVIQVVHHLLFDDVCTREEAAYELLKRLNYWMKKSGRHSITPSY